MDRINFKCEIEGQDIDLQLDKKAMPGEAGPCFMITTGGCFKGYIARKKNGSYQPVGTPYFSAQELLDISKHLGMQMAGK